MELVKREAIESGNCRNNTDPLILSFRIMSENDKPRFVEGDSDTVIDCVKRLVWLKQDTWQVTPLGHRYLNDLLELFL